MKFSIIVPAYKPQFLVECIESILAQTYQDWELILVNDASPYDIDGIVSKFDDERIHYRKREQGFGAKRLVENWNDCLRYVTGDYVINMGDDDKLLPNCLSDYLELIGKNPGKNIYHTRVEYINERSEVTKVQDVRPVVDSVYDMILRKMNGARICIGEFLFYTPSLKARGGFYNIPYAWGSDDITSYEAAMDKGCANCNYVGFQYRDSDYAISKEGKYVLEKYEATMEWENFYVKLLRTMPEKKEEQQKYNEIKNNYRNRLLTIRKMYVDLDIRTRRFNALWYWLRRIRSDKSAELKKHTLFVFLYYTYKKIMYNGEK